MTMTRLLAILVARPLCSARAVTLEERRQRQLSNLRRRGRLPQSCRRFSRTWDRTGGRRNGSGPRGQQRRRSVPRLSARRQRIPSIGWEPKFRLVHFSLWKIRLVMWRKAHGPGSHPVASFHLCDRPVSRFLRFNCGCAQLAWLALDEGAK